MPTRYILHGGATSTPSSSNDLFFSKFTSYVNKDEVSILMACWARPKNRWNEIFERDKSEVVKRSNKKVTYTLVETSQDLITLLPNYDVVYITGGDAENIEPYYKELDDMRTRLEGKVYLGSSMGAFMVWQNYVLSDDAVDTTHVHKGIGLLNLNCLCHWNVEPHKEEKVARLKAVSNLPIVTLDEGQFAEFVV